MKDLAARAGVDAASPPSQLDQAAWTGLHSAWSTWLQAIQTGAPHISSDCGARMLIMAMIVLPPTSNTQGMSYFPSCSMAHIVAAMPVVSGSFSALADGMLHAYRS